MRRNNVVGMMTAAAAGQAVARTTAALAPDANEDYAALAQRFPTLPATAGIAWSGDWGQLTQGAFLRDFAGDVPAAKARVLYAV